LSKTILLLTTDAIPKVGRGGPGAIIERLARELNVKAREYGWRPMVISRLCWKTKQFHHERILGNRITRYLNTILSASGPFGRFLRTTYRLTLLLKKLDEYERLLLMNLDEIYNADIIHAHDIFAMFVLLKILKPYSRPKPILLSIHDPRSTSEVWLRLYPEERTTRLGKYLRQLEIYVILSSTALVMPSNAAKEYLKEVFFHMASLIDSKSEVVYNGIENTNACMHFGVKGKIREELGLQQVFLCVSVGRLVKEKGYDILIKAISLLPTPNNVHVLIVGDGLDRECLEATAYELGLSDRIHFLGLRKDVPEILGDCDLYISSSRAVAFDLALLEAMRAGLPIVASRVGGNKEAIVEDSGLLVDPEPEEISKAMKSLIQNSEKRIELGERARSRFTNLFTVESMAKQAINVYARYVKNYATFEV